MAICATPFVNVVGNSKWSLRLLIVQIEVHLDRTSFWPIVDLETNWLGFQDYHYFDGRPN